MDWRIEIMVEFIADFSGKWLACRGSKGQELGWINQFKRGECYFVPDIEAALISQKQVELILGEMSRINGLEDRL
jgi:hypothetical protein